MMTVTLKVVGGDLGRQEIPLELPAVLGRSRDAAVNLSHPLVSRRHCELTEVDGLVVVRDLRSLNGTFIGSERVDEGVLKPGDLLTVGTVTFRAMYTAIDSSAPSSDNVLDEPPLPEAASATHLDHGDSRKAATSIAAKSREARQPASSVNGEKSATELPSRRLPDEQVETVRFDQPSKPAPHQCVEAEVDLRGLQSSSGGRRSAESHRDDEPSSKIPGEDTDLDYSVDALLTPDSTPAE